MKKVGSLLLAIVLTLSLSACGNGNDVPNNDKTSNATDGSTAPQVDEGLPNDQTDNATEATSAVQVDEGLFNVDVTLAASFFEDMTEEEIKAAAKEDGISDCKINADGSVTYTMTKAKHTEMLNEMKAGFDELIAGLLDGEDAVASFVDIQHNDNYSKIDIFVDANVYTAWDSMYALSFYITGVYYQAFAGVASEDMDVVVNFINSETKEVIETASYKEYLSNSGSEG